MNDIVYKGFRQDELEYEYNPRESVPEYPEQAKKRAEASRRARAVLKSFLNISYGSSLREVLDIYPRKSRVDQCWLTCTGLLAKRQQR